MYKKSFFIVFEGIEGSGKSYQAKALFRNLQKSTKKVILTREPGGTKSAELIRNLILKDYFNKSQKEKFDKYTDTLLYLAARNEHVKNKILPELIDNLMQNNCEVRGCEAVQNINPNVIPATEKDWTTEYLLPIISIKVVKSLNEAILHIEEFSSGQGYGQGKQIS